MVCRLVDQVVTFLLGGENACCGSAMCRERLDQLWHGQGGRGERCLPFCIPLLFILTLSEYSGQTQTKLTNKTHAKELGWLNRQLCMKTARVCPWRGIQANREVRQCRVQVDLLIDTTASWFALLIGCWTEFYLCLACDSGESIPSNYSLPSKKHEGLCKTWFKIILNHCGLAQSPGENTFLLAVWYCFSSEHIWSGRCKEQFFPYLYRLWLRNDPSMPVAYFSLQSVLYCNLNVALQNKYLGLSPPLFFTKKWTLLKVNWMGKKMGGDWKSSAPGWV